MNDKRFNERVLGIGLDKPHVYWSSHSGEWLRAKEGAFDKEGKALDWCVKQDRRWTPRDKP